MHLVSRFFSIVLVTIVLLFTTGCFLSWGKRLEFNEGDLYFKESVSQEEAVRLGEYLVESGFFNGDEKTVQLRKNGVVYEVRIVIQDEFIDDSDFERLARNFSLELSNYVFNNQEVHIHFCDKGLETVHVIIPLDFDEGEVFQDVTVSLEETIRLGDFLEESGFFDGEKKAVLLAKEGETYIFKMIVQDGFDLDDNFIEHAQEFTEDLSVLVFNGSPVDIHFCNGYFETFQVVQYSSTLTTKQ